MSDYVRREDLEQMKQELMEAINSVSISRRSQRMEE